MTITDLILNYRATIVSILPMIEVLGIRWRRGEAYDDWDDIVNFLYKRMVSNIVVPSGDRGGDTLVRLAEYDLMLREYRDCATIEVHNRVLGPGRWVFHAFGTATEPFDIVEVLKVSPDAIPCSEELHICAVAGSRFSLTFPNGSRIEHVPVDSDPQ